ncbi:hypothetical protein PMAYCL1PPCAC_26096, partial [Pristionchus mayeri]
SARSSAASRRGASVMSARKTAHTSEEGEDNGLEVQLIGGWRDIPDEVMKKLIEEIEVTECLWKKSNALYKNVAVKERIWRELEDQFGIERGVAASTLKRLKQAFAASTSKDDLPSGSACPSPRRKKEFKFKDNLMFLKSVVPQTNKRKSSTVAQQDQEDWGSSDEEVVGIPIKKELSEGTKKTLTHIGPIIAKEGGEPLVKTSRMKKQKKDSSIEDLLSENSHQIESVMTLIRNKESSSSSHTDIHSKLDQCLSRIPSRFIDDFKLDVYASLTSLTKKYCEPAPSMYPSPALSSQFPFPYPPFGHHPNPYPPIYQNAAYPPPNQAPSANPPQTFDNPLHYLP